MNSYPLGSSLILSATFTDIDNHTVDPTTITCSTRDPLGVEFDYADPEVIKVSSGVYSCQIAPTVPGVWRYRWRGIGAVLAANESKFEIKPSDFMPQV
jgi:hypothetical protein